MIKPNRSFQRAALIALLLSSAPALAEGDNAVAVPPGFIPLPSRQAKQDAGMHPLPRATPRFIALGPHNFKAVLRPSHSAQEAKPSVHTAEVLPSERDAVSRGGHEIMTSEKAQQIISIFDPER